MMRNISLFAVILLAVAAAWGNVVSAGTKDVLEGLSLADLLNLNHDRFQVSAGNQGHSGKRCGRYP